MSALTQLPQDRSRSKALFDLNMNQQVLEQKPDSRRHHVGPPCLLTIVGVTWGHMGSPDSKQKEDISCTITNTAIHKQQESKLNIPENYSQSLNLMRVVRLHCHPIWVNSDPSHSPSSPAFSRQQLQPKVCSRCRGRRT